MPSSTPPGHCCSKEEQSVWLRKEEHSVPDPVVELSVNCWMISRDPLEVSSAIAPRKPMVVPEGMNLVSSASASVRQESDSAAFPFVVPAIE